MHRVNTIMPNRNKTNKAVKVLIIFFYNIFLYLFLPVCYSNLSQMIH